MYACCTPANAVAKVNPTFRVRTLPEPDTEDVAAFSVHWLLETVPATPGVNGPSNAPELLSRYKALARGVYCTLHAVEVKAVLAKPAQTRLRLA